MTVLSVNPIAVTSSEDNDGFSTYVVTYRIHCDNSTDGVRTCFASGLLASYGDTYVFYSESNSDAFYRNYSNFRYEDGKTQRLTRLIDITFGSKPTWTKPQGLAGNPLSEPWKAKITFTDVTKFTGVDRNGATIMNSAREPRIVEIPFGHPVVHIEGYTSDVSVVMMDAAVKHCNSATIWGLTARKVYMRTWEADPVYHNTTPYVHHVMDFEIDSTKWNEKFMDYGTREMDSAGPPPTFRPILDKQKRPTGGHLGGNGLLNNWTTNPNGVVAEYEVIPQFDFTTIPGLPNPLPSVFI